FASPSGASSLDVVVAVVAVGVTVATWAFWLKWCMVDFKRLRPVNARPKDKAFPEFKHCFEDCDSSAGYLVMLDPFLNSTIDAASPTRRLYYFVDVGASLLLSALAAMSTGGRTWCVVQAFLVFVFAVAYAVYYWALRPLRSKLESAFAYLVAGLQVVLGG